MTLVIRSGAGLIDGLTIPLPSRLAALIAKAAAMGLPDGRERHLLDALHLAATLRPADLDEPLTKADRRWLRNLQQHAEQERAWADVGEGVRMLAQAALERLSRLAG